MKKMLCFGAVVVCTAAGFVGCNMFQEHPYEVRIHGERDINARNVARIEALPIENDDTLRFVLMGDSQRFYDQTEDMVESVNRRADSIDFLIHGGDLSDFGVTNEFLWQRDLLQELQVPYVVLIGNHDCLGTGDVAFRKIFGNPNFGFTARNVRFVCLNTNAMEYDYSNSVPDFAFMEREMSADANRVEYTVVVMHAPPLGEQFNNNVANVFEKYVKSYRQPLFCLHAHNHCTQINELFNDGMVYYGCDCMKHRSYLLFRIFPNGKYDYEEVRF